MKKLIILILFFSIFTNLDKVYAFGLKKNKAVENKTNIAISKIDKNKKITLSSFYTDEINETNIKEYIDELKEDLEETKKVNNFMEKLIDILENLYNEENNK